MAPRGSVTSKARRLLPILNGSTGMIGRNATMASSGDVAAGDLLLAKEWFKAYDVARQAGFSGLGESQEAYFDVVT